MCRSQVPVWYGAGAVLTAMVVEVPTAQVYVVALSGPMVVPTPAPHPSLQAHSMVAG